MAKQHAVITDERVAELRRRIGVPWQPREPYFNTVATRDAILHFVRGIGDQNPLWTDPDYAQRTRYGCLVAPPLFLYSVYFAAAGRGMPGIHAWHSGNDWEFYRPILVNDALTYTNTLTDVIEKQSKMAGRTLLQYHEIVYKNQRGEMVARCKDWCVRAGRSASREQGKYQATPRATYTEEEIRAIYDSYDREEIRGAGPRYWEDVSVGQELTPVVKGPLTLRDLIAWLMGAGSPFMRGHGLALGFQRRHPGVAMRDSATGLEDVPELVHMEDSRAQEVGLPVAYDYGCQRISWLGHLLTNWMGDDGFLKRLRAELRRFNMIGDTTWCKGKVIKKYAEAGEHLADIECWGENQRGEVTMPGMATVVLPSRAGISPPSS